MKPYKQTGIILRNYRGERTQQDLAKELKVHPQFISNWERGICLPPVPVMKTIWKRLNNPDKSIFAHSYKVDVWNTYLGGLE